MILAFNADKEREENLRLLHEATRQELALARMELTELQQIVADFEAVVESENRERVMRHARAM